MRQLGLIILPADWVCLARFESTGEDSRPKILLTQIRSNQLVDIP